LFLQLIRNLLKFVRNIPYYLAFVAQPPYLQTRAITKYFIKPDMTHANNASAAFTASLAGRAGSCTADIANPSCWVHQRTANCAGHRYRPEFIENVGTWYLQISTFAPNLSSYTQPFLAVLSFLSTQFSHVIFITVS